MGSRLDKVEAGQGAAARLQAAWSGAGETRGPRQAGPARGARRDELGTTAGPQGTARPGQSRHRGTNRAGSPFAPSSHRRGAPHSGHKSPENLGVSSERCPSIATRRRKGGELGPIEAAQWGAGGPARTNRRECPEARPPAAPGTAPTDRTSERGRCAVHRDSRVKTAAPGPGKGGDGRRSVPRRQRGRRGHLPSVPRTGAMPEPLPLLLRAPRTPAAPVPAGGRHLGGAAAVPETARPIRSGY